MRNEMKASKQEKAEVHLSGQETRDERKKRMSTETNINK